MRPLKNSGRTRVSDQDPQSAATGIAVHPQDGACRHCPHPHAAGMFVVTEAEATAIRTAFEQQGELSAAVELRRLFPGITDNVQARECARVIAGWKPLPLRPRRLPRSRKP